MATTPDRKTLQLPVEGEGVRLRLPVPRDGDTLFRWINDRDLVLLNAPFKPVARPEHDAWFHRVLVGSGRDLFFIVELTNESQVIGSCQLLGVHPVHRCAELQIRIGERGAQGRGFGTEAVRLLILVAFDQLRLHRVGLSVFATNARAIRAYEKAGFTREGRARQAAFIDGKFIDVVTMGILNERG